MRGGGFGDEPGWGKWGTGYKHTHTHKSVVPLRPDTPNQQILQREDSRSRSFGKKVEEEFLEIHQLERLPRDRDAIAKDPEGNKIQRANKINSNKDPSIQLKIWSR